MKVFDNNDYCKIIREVNLCHLAEFFMRVMADAHTSLSRPSWPICCYGTCYPTDQKMS